MLIKRVLSNKRGTSTLAVIFWLLVLGAAGYCVSKIVPVYFSYYMLKTDMDGEVIKNAHMYSDAAMEKLILEKAHSWAIPLGPDDVVINRLIDSIYVQVKWNETIDINGFYTKTVYFNITREAPLKEGPYGVH